MVEPTTDEARRRELVLQAVLDAIARDLTIVLPRPDGLATGRSETALQHVGAEPNPFGGMVGPFRYQFEGEEDLLHLIVVRENGTELSAIEGQQVAAWILAKVPPGLVWFKPGRLTQHFYVGHDDLSRALQSEV